ncbi:MAG: hypothetical protein HQK62_11740 [Desulfamplus sp.]|nr:hypothetical protein [Desulfamplus sp.]MBF0259492.1 hypothetical protein [Desulfamplus sp.]
MKKIMILVVVTVFGIVATSGCVQAGHRRHHSGLIEGVIIGAGAALIGASIIAEAREHDMYDRHPGYDRHERKRNSHYYKKERYRRDHYNSYKGGYWSVEKVWVEPVYGKRWNPGHYNRRGYWVPGSYDRVIIQDGYWVSKRIWVRN